MEINRDNCEGFFLRYIDNELNATEKKAVDDFVLSDGEMRKELNALLQTRLFANETTFFPFKELLYKNAGCDSLIHSENYETNFLLYADNELTATERVAVEDFVTLHPLKRNELKRIQQLKLTSDSDIEFPNITALYRTETRVIRLTPLLWWRIASAASVIAVGAWLWMNAGEFFPGQQIEPAMIVNNKPQLTPPKAVHHPSVTRNATVKGATEGRLAPLGENGVASAHASENLSTPMITQASKNNKQSVDITATPDLNPNLEIAGQSLLASGENADPIAPDVEVAIAPQQLTATRNNVQPIILDQTDFRGENEHLQDFNTKQGQITYLDDAQNEKKSKGTFRKLFRHASRLVDHVTNPDTNNKQSIVRIAGFEIVKK